MSYRADRNWWAYVLGAFVILGATAAIYYDAIASTFARRPSGENWTLILSAVTIAAFSLAFVGIGLRARKRWRLRRQAIEGDPLAMPESKVFPDVNEVFDVSREPLTLLWRVESPFRRAFASVILGASTNVALLGILAPLAERVWSPPANSPLAVILDIASHQPLLVIVLWIPIYFLVAWLLRNRLVIIEATGDGIRFQPFVGRIFVMRWQDVRLFEVEEPERKPGYSRAVTRSYALYDRRQMISWNEWGTRLDLLQPYDITWDEMWALSRELVDVIYQRTGLMPRTFSKSLRRGPEDRPERTWWEDDEEMEATTLSTEFQVANPTYGPSLNHGLVYETAIGSEAKVQSLRARLFPLGLSIVFVSVFLLSTQYVEVTRHTSIAGVSPLPASLVFLAVVFMPLGGSMVVLALRAKVGILLADATGLHRRSLISDMFLPWGNAKRIERRHFLGTESYVVYGIAYGRHGTMDTYIFWPRISFDLSYAPRKEDAILLSTDEMAALVAEQISQPIQDSGRS